MINLNDQGQVFPSANQVQSDNGGTAFPRGEIQSAPGMTLRDYFAAKASEEDIAEYLPATVGEAKLYPNHTRQWARYKHADAMLKARDAA